jgi:AraC-like DNA-binding protein
MGVDMADRDETRQEASPDASVGADAVLPVARPFTPHLVAAGAASGVLAPRQLLRAMALLQANVSVGEVAAQCGLSRGWFCQAFKRSTGHAPHRWLQEVRIARAQTLLLADMPIVEVADRCGFADQSHLTRVFGRLVGMPPARWRARNK